MVNQRVDEALPTESSLPDALGWLVPGFSIAYVKRLINGETGKMGNFGLSYSLSPVPIDSYQPQS